MKRIAIRGVVLLLVLSLTGCGVKEAGQQSPDTQKQDGTKEAEMFDFENKTVKLNSGYEMPIIGLGTWTLSDEEAEESVYQALKVGMRLIDTARYYGNEVGVGRGLQRAIDEGIRRQRAYFGKL